LKQAYLDGDGDMKYILDSVPCCTEEDQERFSDLLMDWVEKDELPFLKNFRQLTAKELKVRSEQHTISKYRKLVTNHQYRLLDTD